MFLISAVLEVESVDVRTLEDQAGLAKLSHRVLDEGGVRRQSCRSKAILKGRPISKVVIREKLNKIFTKV